MKFICVGRNYADHAREMQAERPAAPVLFLKPDGAQLRNNQPFYYPPHSQEVHHELEVVYRIAKPGKFIDPAFAWGYVDGVGLGIDFTARDVQARQKEKGLPWDIAKGFHQSAPYSEMLPLATFPDHSALPFALQVNGETRQQGTTADMLFSLPEILAYASQFFLLKIGDLVYTGTPAGVGPVQVGDRLTATLAGHQLLDFVVK